MTFSVGVEPKRHIVICPEHAMLKHVQSGEYLKTPILLSPNLLNMPKESVEIDKITISNEIVNETSPPEPIKKSQSTRQKRPDKQVYIPPRAKRPTASSVIAGSSNVLLNSFKTDSPIKVSVDPVQNSILHKQVNSNCINVCEDRMNNSLVENQSSSFDSKVDLESNSSSYFNTLNNTTEIKTSNNSFDMGSSPNAVIEFKSKSTEKSSPNKSPNNKSTENYQSRSQKNQNGSPDLTTNSLSPSSKADQNENCVSLADNVQNKVDHEDMVLQCICMVNNGSMQVDNKVVKDNNIYKRESRNNSSSEDNWESFYDENGECLEPSVLSEITAAVGKVKLEKPIYNYLEFKPFDPDVSDGRYDHIVELYDFSAEYKTQDLLMLLLQFKERGFDIKWVDDTHALAVFNSPHTADEALSINSPFVRLRPLSQAISASKWKAKKAGEILQPYKARPDTSASVARRLVSGALGLKVQISKEQREMEKQRFMEAKERRRKALKLKQEIWDGSVQ